MEEISGWSEFGLAGLVVAALFSIMFIIVKWLIAHIDKEAERHQSERSEWREVSKDAVEGVETAVDKMSDRIQDLSHKITSKGREE